MHKIIFLVFTYGAFSREFICGHFCRYCMCVSTECVLPFECSSVYFLCYLNSPLSCKFWFILSASFWKKCATVPMMIVKMLSFSFVRFRKFHNFKIFFVGGSFLFQHEISHFVFSNNLNVRFQFSDINDATLFLCRLKKQNSTQ